MYLCCYISAQIHRSACKAAPALDHCCNILWDVTLEEHLLARLGVNESEGTGMESLAPFKVIETNMALDMPERFCAFGDDFSPSKVRPTITWE